MWKEEYNRHAPPGKKKDFRKKIKRIGLSPINRGWWLWGSEGPYPPPLQQHNNTMKQEHNENQVLLDLIEKEIRTHAIIEKLYAFVALPIILAAVAYLFCNL